MEYQDIFKNQVILYYITCISVYFDQIFMSSYYTSKL
jgi:hypothetical protein